MPGKICGACGYGGKLRAVVEHPIAPEEITEQADTSSLATALLCSNCLSDMYVWYSKRVSRQAYDLGTKRFRPRSDEDMIKEYEAAYEAFIRYKNQQRKKG